MDHLHETNASFHSYTCPSCRTYRIIITNSHNATLHTEINSAFAELGHSAKNIYNAKNKDKSTFPQKDFSVITQHQLIKYKILSPPFTYYTLLTLFKMFRLYSLSKQFKSK
jgi:hypothetical protein